jgi:hypothetical protein
MRPYGIVEAQHLVKRRSKEGDNEEKVPREDNAAMANLVCELMWPRGGWMVFTVAPHHLE